MAQDLMSGRGKKSSGMKSPVADTKVKMGGKSTLMPKRKMKGRR